MLNHTKGTAKKWLLQDYKGERRWSHIVRKKMKQRFVTRPREEDLRRSRSNDVSEKYKMIKFKKGLRSNQLRELVKTQIHESLDELFDAARSFNPRDVPAEKPTGSQNPYPGSNKKAGALKNKSSELGKCSSSRCLAKGHTEDKCWMRHPELRPAWFKDGGGNDNDKMWEVLSAIQTDLAKIKPNIDSTNAQNRVFHPGTKANYTYFESGNGEKKLTPERYLIKTEFVEQQGWMKGVVDHGAMQVTYANGKTESVRQQTIQLTVFVEELPAFKFAFYLCHIPNQCDIMLGKHSYKR
ncbi:uncharacterized protein PITG_20512 [Phytophthora infestans T30-4]|uniref:Uncharacterized protein n=1 Tax=Phytophthora infestans (strain T30-4) TaxID=403677 RepID=D0P201_PHYIT|nr:uncharacterized protein PITG_20512 [Phytophthora infestans T30-4]EEY55145.1 conserved hypothetical protein [Phytophthora infestans T30-4]|eukprot:XP_002895683.1 conserved hypothetical protein [Phytophthora infestans T30-4]